MAQDPICGMQVDEETGIRINYAGKDYFFCSQRCKEKFLKEKKITSETTVCLTSKKKPFFKNKLFIVFVIAAFLSLLSIFIPFLEPLRKNLFNYVRLIWWAVFLGLFLGGVIDYYIPREYISKVLAPKKPITIFNAVFLGFFMSACSHGILALSMQLHKKGASNPAVVSFLLASPWANFTFTVMMFGFFGLKGLLVILSALVIAMNTGFIYMFLEKRGLIEKNKNTVEVSEEFSILQDMKARAKNYKFTPRTLLADLKGITSGAIVLSDMVLWWIILGILIASIAASYIPVHFFHKFMGPTFLGMLVTLALATVIEVCSEGSSPLAFEIYRQTGALGNSFIFLMAGVATDYTEIGLLWSNVGRRAALWLPLTNIPQILLIGYLMNIIFK